MTPRIRQLQRTVHAAAREIGLDPETRRELQLVATGKGSTAEMDEAELQRVVDALQARGWKPKRQGSARRPAAPRADLRLVHVLWGLLGRAGKLERTGREGLNAFVRRRFGEAWGSVPADVDMLREHAQIDAVIQALRAWCDREGIDTKGGRR